MAETLLYARTSTTHQNEIRQVDGIKYDHLFFDQISGGTANRPKLKELKAYARKGDIVICHQIDRFARSLVDLCELVKFFTDKGVTVKFLKENLTFTGGNEDATSTLMLHMLGAVAQFEKALINSRVREGVRKAQEAGKYKGKQRSTSQKTVDTILKMKADGLGATEIARAVGLSRASVYRYLKSPEDGGCKNATPR